MLRFPRARPRVCPRVYLVFGSSTSLFVLHRCNTRWCNTARYLTQIDTPNLTKLDIPNVWKVDEVDT